MRTPPIASGLLLLFLPAMTAADTFTVTISEDTADGTCDAHCSLREAIIAANGHPGSDTVQLPIGEFVLTRAGSGENACLTGDLDVTDSVQVIGMGSNRSVIRGVGTDRVFEVRSGSLRLTDLGISGGGGVDDGGALLAHASTPVDLSWTAFVGNDANVNGGAVRSDGALTAADCLFAGNTSGAYGAALFVANTTQIRRSTFVGNRAVFGGGAVHASDAAALTVADSLIAGNIAGYGGGIEFDRGTGTLTNVTFSANTTVNSNGGAILLTNADVTLKNCTLVLGSAESDGACLGLHGTSDATFENTILTAAGNSFPCLGQTTHSLGHNLGLCWLSGPGDIPNTNHAGIGLLRDNGGPTLTHELLVGSPAIDAGGGSFAAADQRGTPRPVGAAADIGAYEADGHEPPIGTPITVPVIAHLDGVGGTPWRSDVAISNGMDVLLPLALRYTPNEGTPVTATVTLDEFETVALEDLVATTFGLGDGHGSLTVVPPLALPYATVLSRTYAVSGSQRLGQGMPALRPMPAGTYYVPGLREDALYRSNLGVTAGDEDVTVQVDLFRGTDGAVGTTFAQSVPAGTQAQWRFPVMFPGLAQTEVPMTVMVRIFGEAAPYGSLVDQVSSDAVTLMAQSAGAVWTVPVIAHNPGESGTFWRSDLYLHNPNPVPARVELEYLPEGVDNSGGGATATVTVPAFATTTVADVAGTLFGIADGKGALALVGSPPFVVSSRTYTTRASATGIAPTGTYGLGVPAVPPWQITAGAKNVAGIRVGGGYRTNLGFFGGDANDTIRVTLYGADGSWLDNADFSIPARSLYQASVESIFDVDWQSFTSGLVRVNSTKRPLLVYTSVVDGSSQDPIFQTATPLMY